MSFRDVIISNKREYFKESVNKAISYAHKPKTSLYFALFEYHLSDLIIINKYKAVW
jgi:hypothetical protein